MYNCFVKIVNAHQNQCAESVYALRVWPILLSSSGSQPGMSGEVVFRGQGQLQLDVTYLDMSPSPGCDHDFIAVFDGTQLGLLSNTEAELIGVHIFVCLYLKYYCNQKEEEVNVSLTIIV